ncbi:family 20 glycosylhydrolase [Streptomyces sp. NPDC057362]|uniref:family 20 glycosylhydrolase n=1 Tax=Streptomyces sp. NPDC057362 TaxID=3346106 RepID=UPI00363FBD88
MCENVLDFFRTVLDEVMDVFPSPYVHIGGDEVPTTGWERSPRSRARAAREGLAGRRPVVRAESGVALPLHCTVMSRRDPAHARAAALRGHRVVHADHRATYFDYARGPGAGGPPAQPGGIVDLRAVHDVDLASPTPEAASRVLGAQGQLWTEFVRTPEHIEHLTHPRLCALADRVWAGAPDWPGFSARLTGHRARLDALGVPHADPPAPAPVPPRVGGVR